VQPDPRTGVLPVKTQRVQLAADRLGRAGSLFRPNLAITFTGSDVHGGHDRFGVPQGACTYCGECDIGCNVGAKNTLDLNYLALAERHGAQVGTLTEATSLERTRATPCHPDPDRRSPPPPSGTSTRRGGGTGSWSRTVATPAISRGWCGSCIPDSATS
jgi:hypothetical protein